MARDVVCNGIWPRDFYALVEKAKVKMKTLDYENLKLEDLKGGEVDIKVLEGTFSAELHCCPIRQPLGGNCASRCEKIQNLIPQSPIKS